MDKFTFSCPECGKILEAQTQWVNMKTTCHYCTNEIIIPQQPPKAIPKAKPVIKSNNGAEFEQSRPQSISRPRAIPKAKAAVESNNNTEFEQYRPRESIPQPNQLKENFTENVNRLAITGFIIGLFNVFICNFIYPLVEIFFRFSFLEIRFLIKMIYLTIQAVFLMLACFGFAQSDKYVKGLKSLGICGIILNLLAIISSPIVSYGIARLYYHFFK